MEYNHYQNVGSVYRSTGEQQPLQRQQHQLQLPHHPQIQPHSGNGMKRPRDNHGFHHVAANNFADVNNSSTTSDTSCVRMTKRFKRMGYETSFPSTTNTTTAEGPYNNNNNNNNNHYQTPSLLLPCKSDDEISLVAEELVQTVPNTNHAFPNHCSCTGPVPQLYAEQQSQSQLQSQQQQQQQPHATDYQPLNSLLGNLHALRQQQQQRRRQQQDLAEAGRVAQQVQQQQQMQMQIQQQQQQQQHYHRDRHYGNYHSVPAATTTTSSGGQGGNRVRRRNAVSLRVSSNLY
eukprot:jgi/Psemu1/65410/estExt_Genemark1.C_1240072